MSSEVVRLTERFDEKSKATDQNIEKLSSAVNDLAKLATDHDKSSALHGEQLNDIRRRLYLIETGRVITERDE
jgi:hypothetical protein